MSIVKGNSIEVIEGLGNGNPTFGMTQAMTIARGTTIVGSIVWYCTYGGQEWTRTFFTDGSSQVVALSSVTTI